MTFAPHPLYVHLRRDTTLKIVLAAFLIYWICMLPALLGSASASQASARALTLPAMIAMYWIASSKTGELARTLRVLGQMQAPHTLRRERLGTMLRMVALAWLFLAGGACLQLALPASGVRAISGAALVSLAGCIGVLRGLAGAGKLAPAARYLLDAAPFLLMAAILLFNQNQLLDWFGTQPAAALWLPVLGMPALLATLLVSWSNSLPHYRWTPAPPKNRLAAWLASHNRRTTVLAWRKNWDGDTAPHEVKADSLPMRLFMVGGPILYLIGTPAWVEGQFNPARAVPLLLAVAWIAGALVARDLHWRSLLQPGGLRRGNIGTYLWACTLSTQLALCAVLAVAVLLWYRLGMGGSWEMIGAFMLRKISLPVELCFVTSVAVLLRAARGAGQWAGVIYVTFVALIAAPIFLVGYMGFDASVSFGAFAAGAVAGTGLMLLMANRFWTTRQLFAEAARTAV